MGEELGLNLKVIIPVSVPDYDELVVSTYDRYKLSDVAIEVAHLPKGPKEILSEVDDAEAAPYILKEAVIAEKNRYDGLIVYCFDDPGVYAARSLVKIPVVGLGEPSLTLAHFVSHRFSVLSPGRNHHQVRAYVERQCLEFGLAAKLASVRPITMSPLTVVAEQAGTLRSILQKEIKSAIEENGADTIVFGCGAMSGFLETLDSLGTTLIDPGIAALNFIEVLMNMGVSHSRLVFTP